MAAIVLVVDDNPINLKLIKLILADEGYELHTASNATETRNQLALVTPALILMDIQLPGTDGLALTRELRQIRRLDATFVVALTAHAMKGDDAKALAAGCDGYITKPIDTEVLPRRLAELLAKPRRSGSSSS